MKKNKIQDPKAQELNKLINLNQDSRQYYFEIADETQLKWLWENGFFNILKKKAERDNINLPQDVFNYIAENITSNVRALEGSLVKIQAWTGYKGINSERIDVELIKDILKDMFSEKKSRITLDLIRKKVCNNFNISGDSIFLKTRKSEIAQPRQVAMYLSNLYIPSLTLKTIANYYKLKDHTTVLHAIKSTKTKIETDNNLKYQVQSLMDQLKS
jgi:chromosomal replication initiator protein